MELDTGAPISVINQSTYLHIQTQRHAISLQPSRVKLNTYTGQDIPILGSTSLQARYSHKIDVVIQVVTGNGPNLLGRDLLKLEVDLGPIYQLSTQPNSLGVILDKHPSIFRGTGMSARVRSTFTGVDDKIQPRFHTHHIVPFILQEKITNELQRLQSLGIISNLVC